MASKPLTARSWLTLFTSFVILTVAFAFGLFCWPAIYRPLTKAYGWTFAQANAGGSIILFLIGILSPFVGTLVDKFKPKRVILGGTFIIAIALCLLSTIHSRPQYYAFCFLLGIGASAVSILPTSILIGPFFSRWRGLAVGFINAGIGLGGFIAPRLATAQIAQRGISGMFLVLAACMAIPFVMTLIVVDNNAEPRVQTHTAHVPTMPELARMPMFWIFGIALFFSAHAMLGVQQNLISYLTGAHVAPKDAAFILAIALGAAAPGKLISGILADRVNARAGMIFSVICVALGVLALLNTDPKSDMVLWLGIVFGLGYGGIFNAAPTIIFEFFGTHQVGKALGLFYVFFGLGTASGGELAGYLFDETHRWAVPFTVDLGLACVGLLLLLVSARQTRAVVAASPALSTT
ncbi:MAG TPA: MFS transporter [Bryobacteraceae bacterium]|jgi:MFS family permease|nr:MFS transporter [Bryobacteraceae bacterium]